MQRYLPEALICLFLTIAMGIVFYQIHNYHYIRYDDIIPLSTSFVTSGISGEKVIKAFYDPLHNVPYTSPIPVVVRMIQWEMVGNDFGKQHLHSLLFHAVTVIMLFFLLRKATGQIWRSGFCAALFALHPLNVEPVVWLAGMNGLLEAFFLMLALLLYLSYIKKPSFIRYILVLPPFVLGLLCRPTAAVLPLLLLCLDYWPLERLQPFSRAGGYLIFQKNRLKPLLEKIPFFLTAFLLIFGKAMLSFTPSSVQEFAIDFHPGAFLHFFFFLKNILYPAHLSIGYPPPPEASLAAAIAILAALAVATGLILWKASSHPYIITGWLWFFIASSPVILMVFLSGRPVADRHLYIPLIGIFIIISFGTESLSRAVRYGRPVLVTAAALILAGLMITSHTQTRHWENSLTIFRHALSINPENKKALANLGDALLEKGKIQQATPYYRKLVRLAPESAPAYTKLAHALALQGDREKTEACYQKALALAPAYEFAHHNYGDFLIAQERTEEGIHHYRRALSINPRLFQTHNNLATALFAQGKIAPAVFHLEKALAINPDYQTARKNLQKILQQTKPSPAPVPEKP